MAEDTHRAGRGWPELDRRGRQALAALIPDPRALCAAGGKAAEYRQQYAALTGSPIGSLPLTQPGAVPALFTRARAAGRKWDALGFRRRRRIILRFTDLLLALRDPLLDLLQWENGKDRGSAFEEYYDAVQNCLFYARRAHRILRARKVPGAIPLLTSVTVRYRAKGAVGIISPWNYPLSLAFSDAVAALMAGNAVVLKPDSLTPYSALAVKSLLLRAGLPRDVFSVAVGSGRALGAAFAANADYLMFTGSTAVGRSAAAAAGENLIGVSAELGGKNAMIVRADAPAARAAKSAVKACFSSSGQLCVSVERIYVHENIWDTFVPAFLAAVKTMKTGVSMDWDTDMGPLISEKQMRKVNAHVRDALSKGATVLAGGIADPKNSGRIFPPTVLTGVTREMDLFAQETFGPVVALYRVGGDSEAVELANAVRYGLNSVIWTGDFAAGRALAKKLETGLVNINDGYAAAWGSVHAPLGGMKDSGLSYRHGREGIVKYTDIQTVAAQKLMTVSPPPHVGEKMWAAGLTAYARIRRKFGI